jgi:hypothetical protein
LCHVKSAAKYEVAQQPGRQHLVKTWSAPGCVAARELLLSALWVLLKKMSILHALLMPTGVMQLAHNMSTNA